MVMATRCAGRQRDGRACGAWPIRGEAYCLWHSPTHQDEADEARRLGGLRRRREKTLAGAYDITGLRSIEDLRRILEIVVLDTLGLENSVARSRTLISAVLAGTRLHEIGDVEARLAALEAALGRGPGEHRLTTLPEATATLANGDGP
jgi:hypothetical protein